MVLPRQPFLTVKSSQVLEIPPIKHSRFIAHVCPISTEQDAKVFIDKVRGEYLNARHHCWAYCLRDPDIVRFNDDGEPGGSAGKPILNQIQGRDLFDVAVVVVRYFGGVKLGVGGLVRAYGGSAGQLLDEVDLKLITPTLPLWLCYSYSDTASVEAMLAELGLEPLETQYTEKVSACLHVADAQLPELVSVISTKVGGRIQLTLPDIRK